MFTGTYVFSWEYFIPKCNGVLWSLGIELCFSLIFPFVVLAFLRIGSARATYGIIALSLAARLFAVFTQAPVWHGVNPYLNYVRDSVFGRLDDFAVGMFVAHVFARRPKFTVIADGTMVLAGGAFVLCGATLWDLRMASRLPIWSEAFYNIPANIGFGLVLLGCLGLGVYGGRTIKFFLNLSIFQMIGMMSYSLYVWHPLAINNMLDNGRNFWSISATVVIILLASALSYRYIEFGSTKDIKKLIPS
jgi:peptidoglycan/LPS O-acetylase OafA/YrhL